MPMPSPVPIIVAPPLILSQAHDGPAISLFIVVPFVLAALCVCLLGVWSTTKLVKDWRKQSSEVREWMRRDKELRERYGIKRPD